VTVKDRVASPWSEIIAIGEAVTEGNIDGLPLAVARRLGYHITLKVERAALVLNLR
jgi:hypothetical protein